MRFISFKVAPSARPAGSKPFSNGATAPGRPHANADSSGTHPLRVGAGTAAAAAASTLAVRVTPGDDLDGVKAEAPAAQRARVATNLFIVGACVEMMSCVQLQVTRS